LPHVDVSALVAATERFWEYPMCDRDPLPSWTKGRVTLLGDATHPMYPTGSNGAGQAILDAEAISRHLTDATLSIDDALKRYDEERRPKTAEIVRRNRLGGPEQVIDAVERLALDGFDDIDAVLPFHTRQEITEKYADLAGFSKSAVNG
jgi:5-methylphenazine-1-carboxylate 1-monooxygenase